MRVDRIIILLALLGVVISCKPTQIATTTADVSYNEDLSVHRPNVSVNPTTNSESEKPVIEPASDPLVGHIKAEMDSINSLIKERNARSGYTEGYTIQVYTGLEREAAEEALDLALSLDQELNPVITYHQPSYKVKVGFYTNRLEAHEVFQSLKNNFPKALMIPERKAK